MTILKGKSNRKPSGGKYNFVRSKKKYELGPDARPTVVGKEDAKKTLRMRGGESRIKLVKALYANISDKNKVKKAKILNVVENVANRHFARRNVLTKGARIKTDAGEAIVTSRPSQDGVVNAKLIK